MDGWMDECMLSSISRAFPSNHGQGKMRQCDLKLRTPLPENGIHRLTPDQQQFANSNLVIDEPLATTQTFPAAPTIK